MGPFLGLLSFVFLASTAFASKVTVGTTADGRQHYTQEGCTTIENITDNIEGYTVLPEQSYQDRILLCGSAQLVATDMLTVFRKMLEQTQDCLDAKIDTVNKVIELIPGPKFKVVTTVTEQTDSYVIEGSVVYTDKKLPATKKNGVCVISPNGLNEEKILQQILPQN